MKNIWLYYILLVTPLLTLGLVAKYHLISSGNFVVVLLSYGFIYHPLVSGLRLLALGVIPKEKMWKNWIPFWNETYSRELFLGRKPNKKTG
jgi:hypothetical protein